MAKKDSKKRRNKKKDIEDTLPLTEGDGSIYRKDNDGKVNLEKVVSGAVNAAKNFKIVKPSIEGIDFNKFKDAFKNVKISKEEFLAKYNKDEIESVNKGGVVSDIANKIIKNKYGDTLNQ